jgi:hypothetical protein
MIKKLKKIEVMHKLRNKIRNNIIKEDLDNWLEFIELKKHFNL